MADPKIIFLAPACEERNGEREWCEDDAWDACACGTSSTRYNLGEDYERILAERDALQLRLNEIDEQHQGEPVAAWRDMATAPRDGTIVRLLVRFSENATEDEGYGVGSPTIGSNSFEDTGEDLWQFAGWSWEQDCYTQGEGAPIGWLPMLGEMAADAGEVERLRKALVETQDRLNAQTEHNTQRHVEIGMESMRVAGENTKLHAQLAERDALLRDIRQSCELSKLRDAQIDAALSASAEPSAPASFQHRVQSWLMECFGEMIAGDREERNHRFLEEALDLVQALGATSAEAHQLVDYVFGRPVGEPAQEVGGVMVTLAALCLANGLDMQQLAETELARVWTKVEAIRAKQASKPQFGPLPGVYPDREQNAPVDIEERAAISLVQVLRAYDYAQGHPHRYLIGTTNWCAAVAHSPNEQARAALSRK